MGFIQFFCMILFIFAKPSTPTTDIFFNTTVALDGSGDFTSINKAILSAPCNNTNRFYIHLKAGLYREYVEVPKNRTMIALIGDGADKTIITGNRSIGGGYPQKSYTVGVFGKGFMAQYITFENTAGLAYGPASTVWTDSDSTVYYKCTFLGYQDTIKAGHNRQFYKECDIHGIIDFIYGKASAVFQDCNIYVRRHPNPIITANGRYSSRTKTGFVIQNCTIDRSPEVEGTYKIQGVLGRPWQELSTCIIMQSYIADIIDPRGWQEWDTISVDHATYWEYNNTGPGADTTRRVRWKGVKNITNPNEMQQYTVTKFINGDEWLPETKVPYRNGL